MQTIGAVIAAASKRVARPVAKLGGISLIQRLVLTFQKARVPHIVVITGFEEPEIKAQLTGEGVVFVQLADHQDPELIESFRLGLDYLGDRCERVFLTPVNAPMFSYATVLALHASPGQVVIPSFRGRAGHPVLVSADMVEEIRDYRGEGGLAGMIRASTSDRRWIDVNDEGVLYSVHQLQELRRIRPGHDATLVQPSWSLGIRRAEVVFDAHTHLLLRLIEETGSVSGACRSMSLSLSKAWRMINRLEDDLGFRVVNRSHGGSRGGKTHLSEDGTHLLAAYTAYRDRVGASVDAGFEDFWRAIEPLITAPPAAPPADAER